MKNGFKARTDSEAGRSQGQGQGRGLVWRPERTARTVSVRASTSRQYVTGAAAMTLVVKTPAATASPSAAISARSAFGPFARMPACIPGWNAGTSVHSDERCDVFSPFTSDSPGRWLVHCADSCIS